jgi:Na+-transporting methylmalonyl-CoA/oxaloacetate decarboxylase gamma subunit
MYIQNQINSDSLKVVQDSIKAAKDSEVLNSLGFNLSNVGTNDVIITVLGYGIVFLALLILYLFFFNLTKIIIAARKKRLKASGKHAENEDDLSISGEIAAAISMALLQHFQESHDIENTIITIKKVQSTYSPWNSKLHGLRQYPKY